jgi:hypothetical protein
VLIWTRVTNVFFKNFATKIKIWCIYQNIFKKIKKLKNLGLTDDFCPKKMVAHSHIPQWNVKKSTLTIFWPTLLKMLMIIGLVLKTHNFFLEYFMVIKWASYHIYTLNSILTHSHHIHYHSKKIKNHGNPPKIHKKNRLTMIFFNFL